MIKLVKVHDEIEVFLTEPEGFHLLGLYPGLGGSIHTGAYSSGNAFFRISLPGAEPRSLHSYNFSQCLGVVGVSSTVQHQVAHICPGRWVHGVHGTELIEQYRDVLRTYLEKWKEVDIEHIYLFGGKIDPNIPGGEAGYTEGVEILGALLHEVFGNIPTEVLIGPSLGQAHQHIIITLGQITHIQTPSVYTPQKAPPTPRGRLGRFFEWLDR